MSGNGNGRGKPSGHANPVSAPGAASNRAEPVLRVGRMPAQEYYSVPMRPTIARQQKQSSHRLLASGVVAALLLSALAGGAIAGLSQTTAGRTLCPLTAPELSAIVGKTVQRVNLSDADGNPAAQCSFSAVARTASGRFVSPQVFLTVGPGGAADLRDLYLYYLKSRSKLATRPRVSSRSDLGQGAFTLTAATAPVTTAFFPVGKNSIGTLLVDLVDAGAGKREQATAEKVFALVQSRLP